MELDEKLIGIRIMQQRKLQNLTQERLSEQLGISKNHLSGIECGKNLPTTRIIIKICSVLGKTPDYYLIGRLEEESEPLIDLIRKIPPKERGRLEKFVNLYVETLKD